MGRFSGATKAQQAGAGSTDYIVPGEYIVELMKVVQFMSQRTDEPNFVVEFRIIETLIGGEYATKEGEPKVVQPGAIYSQFVNMKWKTADGHINHFFQAALDRELVNDGEVPEEEMERSVGMDQPLEGRKLHLRTFTTKVKSTGNDFTRFEWTRLEDKMRQLEASA